MFPKNLKFERVNSEQNLTGVHWYAAEVPGGHVLAAYDSGGRFCTPTFVPDFTAIPQIMRDEDEAAEAAYDAELRAQPKAAKTKAQPDQSDRLLFDHTDPTHPLERQDKKGTWRRLQAAHKPKVGDLIRRYMETDQVLVITEIPAAGLLEVVPQ